MSKVFAEAFERAIGIAGSEARLGEGISYSQAAINKAKKARHCSAEMALAIDHFTNGKVSAASLRPDLWATPEAVPSPPSAPDHARAGEVVG